MKHFCLIFSFLILNFGSPISTSVAESPNRIISLAPSITETLYSLGLGERLVGVTTYCDYPEEAKKKPKIGGMVNPSLEAIMSLKPDLVILTPEGNTKETSERLNSFKIKTYTFSARRLAELAGALRELGEFLGVKERSDTLAKEIEESINSLKVRGLNSKIIDHGLSTRPKKVLFIIWPEPLIVAGSGTIIDDAITLLGAENMASKAKIPYPKYSMEEIIRESPDVIFIGKGHIEMKETSKGLLKKISTTKAVKEGQVYFISDSLYRMGPRVIRGIEELAAYLIKEHK